MLLRSLFSLFILLTHGCLLSQILTGVVYDDKEVIEGVLVKNLATKITVLTSEKGRFNINASIQDSISFQVFTHEPKTIIIKKEDDTNFVVELTRKVNQLDEVFIEKEFTFKEDIFKENYESTIARHIRLYPEQYEFNSNPNNNLNFVNIGKRLWRLIKKPKPKLTPYVSITLKQYIGLFKEDTLINDRFLVETLHIPIKFKPLFIDFCVSKNVDSELLKEKNQFLLIEEIITLGQEFLVFLESEIKD